MVKIVLAYILAVLPSLFAVSLSGDTIELKTGERIEGAFKQASSAGAVIEVGGQSITIPLEKVKAIYFGIAPSPTTAAPAPSQEAMDALKALRSVTESGISYREYAPRVLDAKVKTDRYLSSPGSDPAEFRKALQTAMREYELASQAWGSQITSSVSAFDSIGRTIEEDAEISTCPAIKQMIDSLAQGRSATSTPRAAMIGIKVGVRPVLLWECASVKVAEAARLMAKR